MMAMLFAQAMKRPVLMSSLTGNVYSMTSSSDTGMSDSVNMPRNASEKHKEIEIGSSSSPDGACSSRLKYSNDRTAPNSVTMTTVL